MHDWRASKTVAKKLSPHASLLSVLVLALLATPTVNAESPHPDKQAEDNPLSAQTTPVTFTPAELFNRVSPSVVVVKATDKDGNVLATGSGVVVAHATDGFFTIATNCHVADTPGSDGLPFIAHGKTYGVSSITARDTAHDLCLLNGALNQRSATGDPIKANGKSVYLPAPPVARIARLRSLEIGERVYAIGAPQGLELSLSEGLVSGLRDDGGDTLIQTTAAISRGSSGGGLFDAQGQLVGITTMFLKDAQALNFAVPAELIASVPAQDAAAAAAREAAATAADAAAAGTAVQPRDRWWTFYRDDEREIAFDLKTVERENNKVIVWTRTRYAKPQRLTSGKAWIELIARNTFFCSDRRTSFDQEMARNAAGDVVHSHQLKSYEIEIESVVPDSIGEKQYEAACNEA